MTEAASAAASASKDKLVTDLKVVLTDVEDLLSQAAAATGERATELRERAADQLRVASGKFADLQEAAVQRGKQAVRVTDDYVHDHPWQAVGIAAAAGIVLGLLLNRK